MTDCQPLVAICNGKNLDAINNMRIQRLLAKTLGYDFRVLWTAGKYNWIADALSRSPVFAAEQDDPELVCTVKTAQICKTSQETNRSYDPALQKIIDIAEEDADYQQCYQDVKKKLVDLPTDHPGQKLASVWSALSIEDDLPGLLLYHGRIFVPQKAVESVLKTLHIQHSAVDKTLRNAKSTYFWPKMVDQIKLMVSGCERCLENSPSQRREPLIQTLASRPMEQVSIDLAQYGGKTYLVLTD